jgi:exodeoxyribonuclease VIII
MKATGLQRISFEEYAQIPRVNSGLLKLLKRSPAHYHYRLSNPSDISSPSKRLGRAVHSAVLEPQEFACQYVVWNDGRRYGKQWDGFCENNAGREILTQAEYEKCIALQQSVRSCPVARKYLAKGTAEVSMFWTDKETRLACKGRADFVFQHAKPKKYALVDLKTTRNASPEGFGREVWRYGYHLQAAFYQDGYKAATGYCLPFVIIAVENEPPYVVQVYTVPDHVLDIGRDEYGHLLRLLAQSSANNQWPGYSDSELELTLPKWATNYDSDEDISGLDLDFGSDAVTG